MRLLFIRPGALGDTLLTFPVIEALRAYSHNSHVTLVGNKAVLPLARAFGLAEEVFDYEESLWSGLFATPPSNPAGTDKSRSHPLPAGTNYANEQINLNTQPTAGTDLSYPWNRPANRITDTINRSLRRVEAGTINQPLRGSGYPTQKRHNPSLHRVLSGIDRAVAWLSDPDNIVYQNLQAAGIPQVTVVPGRPPALERIHVVDYLARSVGVSTNPHPCYGDCPSETDCVLGQERAFAIHPGSGGARKCWPPERFAAVICRLWQRGWPVLLLSGPADHERLEALLKLLPAPPHPSLLKLLVDVPLLDLAPVLCQCRGYLGNDAGMTHLAALLGLPTLALFGPTDPLTWQPRGRAVSIIHEPDLQQLEVDTVVEHILPSTR